MSRRAKLIEKYRKSDIFNLSSTELNPKKIYHIYLIYQTKQIL